MAKAYPSMLALLGLIAVAGYQNRDKIADMSRQARREHASGHRVRRKAGRAISTGSPRWSARRGAGAGGLLRDGLGELVDRFQRSGRGDVAQSWVKSGPNQEIEPNDLEAAIGTDVLAELSERTGLSRDELLARLSRQLPSAVDQYTPEGRLPDA